MSCTRVVIITTLLLLILYIRYLSKENRFFLDLVNLPVLAAIVLFLPVKFNIRIGLLILIIAVFRINISVYFFFVGITRNVLVNKYIGTDEKLRKDVRELFDTQFNFIHNFEDLPTYPTMLVTNYVYDRLEHIACIVIPHEIAIVMGKAMIDLANLDKVVNHLVLRPVEGGSFKKVKQQVGQMYKQGLSIFTYVTKISPKVGYISRIRSGMFTIAKDLGIPVTPIAIDYIHTNSVGAIVPQNFRIIVGKTFMVNSVSESRHRARMFLMEQHKYFIKNKFTTRKTTREGTPKNILVKNA